MSTSWVEKVFPVTSDAVICSASSCVGNEGAEFKEFLREVQEEVFRYKVTEYVEIGNESRLGLESIFFLAKKLIRHKYPSIHVFVAGLCGDTKSENSFKLFEILPGGTGIEGENLLVAGSGGVNIVSLLGDIFLSDSTATVQQAAPQVKRALTAATKLDHGSGGRPVLWTLARHSL
jgi:20S proteasome alpha/beta subunit